mgnify:CR=1 FL=1
MYRTREYVSSAEITFLVTRNFPGDKVSNPGKALFSFCSFYSSALAPTPLPSFPLPFVSSPLLLVFSFFFFFYFVLRFCFVFSFVALPLLAPFSRIRVSNPAFHFPLPFRSFLSLFSLFCSFFLLSIPSLVILGSLDEQAAFAFQAARETRNICRAAARMIKISALFMLGAGPRFRKKRNAFKF